MRLLLGFALGAAGALLLDPQHGPRRRARVRDTVTRGMTDGREFADAATKEIRHRARGLAAQVRSLRGTARRGPISDDMLVERVRAKLGRYSSHPAAIEISAQDGRVILAGDILANEVDRLFDAVRTMRGVEHVDNRLTAYPSAAGVPSLQGTQALPVRLELLQETWSPGIRVMVGGTGALLLLYALARGGLSGIGALGIGALLLARASTNQPLTHLARRRETHST
jgi:hypothetical protein